jgi:isochorismate hydrolase
MSVNSLARATLLVIDVQRAIDASYHAMHGPRNNLGAEANIALLLCAWRREGRPIMHIRHDSTSAASAYRSGQEGNDFKNEVAPLAGEIVVLKQTNSAFIGTDLERSLRAAGDACFTFARPDFRGKMRSAEEVHSMSLANLDGEYCRVVNTSEVLASQLP